MPAETLRLFRWVRQGLDGSLAGAGAATVLERSGWARSVGGASPYLALRARAGLSRKDVDAAVARMEICELPSARGCTYVVPASDFTLALLAGRGHGDARDLAQAKAHCGVTDSELDRLSGKVLDALDREELDPAGIKAAVGDAVRALGPEGKKRGLSSTLPLVLGRLQSQGEIRRVPVNGRLDQQRYRYVRWRPSPLPTRLPDDAEVALELARRFFRWSPGATLDQLRTWAGLGAKVARAAVEALGLKLLAGSEPGLAFPEDLDAMDAIRAAKAPPGPVLSFVGLLDNVLHLRRDVASLLDPRDAVLEVPGEKGRAPLGHLTELAHHAVVDRGRLVGLWDWDGVAGELVLAPFGAAPAGLAKEAKELARFVREELGDVRTFSLDSPESRGPRLEALRHPGF